MIPLYWSGHLPVGRTIVAMDPYAPFTGVLLLPDRAPFDRVSAVTLGSGVPVAMIRWHGWTGRARFDILDPGQQRILASGARYGIFGVQGVAVDPSRATTVRASRRAPGLTSAQRATTVPPLISSRGRRNVAGLSGPGWRDPARLPSSSQTLRRLAIGAIHWPPRISRSRA